MLSTHSGLVYTQLLFELYWLSKKQQSPTRGMELLCHKGAVAGIACLHMHRETPGNSEGYPFIREPWNEPSPSGKRAGTSGRGLQPQGIPWCNPREEPHSFSPLPAMQSSQSFLKPPSPFQSSQPFSDARPELSFLSLPITSLSLPSASLPSPPSLRLRQHPSLVCILLGNL